MASVTLRDVAALGLRPLLYLGVALLPVADPADTNTYRASVTAARTVVVQADENTQANEPSKQEIKQYVAVYIAMQRNHDLTVEQAAAAQGLTVNAFRELEQRIEQNEIARDEARRELSEGAQQTAPSRSGKSIPPPVSQP
jgi:hypothetical protein